MNRSFPTIIYEDNHLIAVDKPAGMLAQADGSTSADIQNALKQYIKTRDHKPGNVYLGLLHRLDRPVSGVMLLAKTSKAAARVSNAFRQRKITKIYHAVVEGTLEKTNGKYIHQISKDSSTRVSHIVTTDGKTAQLNWHLLQAVPHQSLVEIELITGLPHQIRAQFAFEKHPIVGDIKYGAQQRILGKKGVIALYCHKMQLTHPTTGAVLSIHSQPPHFWSSLGVIAPS